MVVGKTSHVGVEDAADPLARSFGRTRRVPSRRHVPKTIALQVLKLSLKRAAREGCVILRTAAEFEDRPRSGAINEATVKPLLAAMYKRVHQGIGHAGRQQGCTRRER